jgi:hypothetical protein
MSEDRIRSGGGEETDEEDERENAPIDKPARC